ncbi:hypothetical protein [Agromyces sp. GXS1127]|uniref:hypothetical protein n=1 Tax=Agromyces sp. GXS1127 TaxID=3424181 RepID=UPI003D314E2F
MTDRRDDETIGEAEAVRREELAAKQTVANDPVAGDTVLPGRGDGNDGETGGAPREGSPVYAENDLADEEIDLDDAPDRPVEPARRIDDTDRGD